MAYSNLVLSVVSSLNSGSFSKFMQVDAVGSLSGSVPAFCMQKGGSSSLNPSNGGLEQLVTNLSNFLFWSSDNVDTTFQNVTKMRK